MFNIAKIRMDNASVNQRLLQEKMLLA